ncbi:kinase-like domain-containing protein [Cytidiella melzeri]|nr:kinase-like domain-containing protein [Cytidiella melzeri]
MDNLQTATRSTSTRPAMLVAGLGRPFPMPDRFRVITPLPTPHSTPGTESSSYLSSVCSTPATDSSASSRWASDVASMTARFAAKRAAVRKAREELTWEKDSYLLLHNGTETYKVLGTLGVGASGRVMSARYNGWDVAVKVIHKHMVYPSTSGRQKFLEELKAMKRVTEADLSFVCPLLSAWADGDNIYFVMPCLRETMLQRINRLPLTRQEVRLYSAEMIHGLSNLHSAGIIHRDIKLENILFDVHGHVVFTDLGCSRIVNPEDNETIQDVRMYDNEGTASYWAPEMVSSPGEHGYGWEVDIWALGMVIYEMATNTTVPFYSGKSPYGIQYEMMLYDVPVERILDQGLQNLLRRVSSNPLA